MKVVFLGVGEACDERLPNTSVLVQTSVGNDPRSVLMDCGFTVPPLYFRRTADPNDLDALWISHFHGDHFFGVPILLLRFWETNRAKPLAIIGQPSIEEIIHQTMNLAYPNFMKRLAFPLTFVPVEPYLTVDVLGLSWRFAENEHGQRSMAVRINDGVHSFFYSGDGRPTPETLDLARGCDLIVHEAFHLEQLTPGHGTVEQCIDFARKAGASSLALVHLQRDVRKDRSSDIQKAIEQTRDIRVFLPRPGDEVEL